MTHHDPPVTIAPHLPADLYRQLDNPNVVVIHTTTPAPARTYVLPIALGLCGAAGVLGVVALAVALFDYAARTAAFVGSTTGPIGLGLALKLIQSKNNK